MKTTGRTISRLMITTIISIAVFAFATELSATDSGTDAKIEFKEARLIIEFNATAEDAGVQMFLDADDWKTIEIFAPNGNLIYQVDGRGKLRKLGMTELFFESVEPSLDDLPLQDFLALFPEGEYKFVGKTIEGDTLVAKVPFTHRIPDGPSINGPKKKDVVDPQNTVISWDPVVTPAGIDIVEYEVIVEGGNPERHFDVFVPGSVTSLTVSPEFLEPDTKYIFEVLAIDVSRNQTISEGAFRTQ